MSPEMYGLILITMFLCFGAFLVWIDRNSTGLHDNDIEDDFEDNA